MDDDGQQVAASIVTRDSAYALIATSWINNSSYILDGMVTLYKLLIVEMDINLSRLLINQESENVSLSMLEFQAYTWPSYLFYELKAMLCCVYVKNYFPRYFLCWFNAKAYCLSMIRRMEKWHNMTYFDVSWIFWIFIVLA